MKRLSNSNRVGSKRILLSAILLGANILCASAQSTEMTKEEAKSMYTTKSLRHVTVHDPSITYDKTSNQYYIFGTHRGCAKTSDLQNWTSFSSPWKVGTNTNASNEQVVVTPAVKKVTKGGAEVDFPAFSAYEWSACLPTYGSNIWGNVGGNMWAPDIIWNPTMQKWCQYLSINGLRWNSSIVLLTSDNIEGPYEYQGPVIITGFNVDGNANVSYKKTDLELVIGTQAALPSRYNCYWGNRWPHAIDPSVFFDEEGKMWMAYGSWSGGIWILELDETTGLRDYNVTYPSTNGNSDGVTSDPYFGKKIAGGYYVSGEGPYIEHIGDYYYLFVTNGGLEANKGYEMRLFRSANPNGPYVDSRGVSAIYSSYALNYGLNCDIRGNKLMGPYDNWGFMTLGERAQGHNSVIAAEDGRSYLVYHTRFNDGTEGHQVRVHQLFINEKGWPVAAPFEYTGETVTNEDIKTKQIFSKEEVAGTYQMLLHKYSMDHNNGEEVLPVSIQLNADGTISGEYTGKWTTTEGTSYIQITIGNSVYYGVIAEQQMEPTTIKAVAFTASNAQGVNIWGYKMRDDYNLAYQLNNLDLPVVNRQNVSMNLNFYNMPINPGINVEWASSHPDIISDKGTYNPETITEDTPVEIYVKMWVGDYYWADTLNVTAQPVTEIDSSYLEGIVAYYDFNTLRPTNAYNEDQRGVRRTNGTGKAITLETDNVRPDEFFHQYFGSNGNCSYTQFNNPLYNSELEDGLTISFWLKMTEENLWDAIFSFFNTTSKERLYMTGNAYFGYNNDAGNWLDINHPTTKTTNYLSAGKWELITITLSRTKGLTLYVNGSRKGNSSYSYSGSQNGNSISTYAGFDYNEIIDFIQNCRFFYFGYGSFWGSADICFDDLLIYNRVMTYTEVQNLKKMCNRVTNFAAGEGGTGIESIFTEDNVSPARRGIYDLMGRKVSAPVKGNIYIINGKKVLY